MKESLQKGRDSSLLLVRGDSLEQQSLYFKLRHDSREIDMKGGAFAQH